MQRVSDLKDEVLSIVDQLSHDEHLLEVMKICAERMIRARDYKTNLLGRRFNRLVVVDAADMALGSDGVRRSRWRCLCSCGKTKTVFGSNIVTGKTKSCGCLQKAAMASRATHGMSETRMYRTWRSMRNRCENPKEWSYRHYGALGIRVCDRWLKFENFYADMGEKPPGTSLDRINVFGNYEPSNCRWATATQQAQNKRNSKLEPHEPDQIRWLRTLGYRQREIADFYGIDPGMVSQIERGKIWK